MRISLRKRLALLCSLAAVTAVVSAGAELNLFAEFNLKVSQLVQGTINGPLTTVLYWLAYANGDWRAIILVAAVAAVIWWRWGRFDAIFLAAAGIISWFNESLKVIFHTARPPADLVQVLARETSAAYPSGHSFFSVMFYGFIAWLAIKNMKKPAGRAVCAACAFMVLLIGFSRIYLGVHWLTDVIGGYLFGGLFLAGLIWFYDFLKSRNEKAADRSQTRHTGSPTTE